MKLLSKAWVLLALMSVLGCATQVREFYPQIPEYPRDASYDTSATCFVPNVPGLEYMAGLLSDNMKKCGFKVYGNEEFDRARPVPPDFVLESLRWNARLGNHNGESVVYVQVIVRVRRPAVLTEDRHIASFGEKPRDFQAVSRRIIGERPDYQADYDAGIAEAMENLMWNPEFRKALEAKRASERDDSFGLEMFKLKSER